MTEMANAELQWLQAGIAFAGFARRTQARVKSAMGQWCSVVLNIIQHALRDLQYALTHNVLVRLDAKLDALEPLGELVDQLLLDGFRHLVVVVVGVPFLCPCGASPSSETAGCQLAPDAQTK